MCRFCNLIDPGKLTCRNNHNIPLVYRCRGQMRNPESGARILVVIVNNCSLACLDDNYALKMRALSQGDSPDAPGGTLSTLGISCCTRS